MPKQTIIDVTRDVKWIGVNDPDLRVFDVIMETRYGTTYNSYFIDAGKKTVVETVKEKFSENYLEKIKSLVNPEEIVYIVMNHTEPDHSGSLKHLLKIAPQAVVVGSGNALRYLKDMIPFEFKSLQVKDGDTLDLGNKTLKFIGAPNLHWPDTIYTWLADDRLLFTCDSFGAHYSDERLFDDQVANFDEAFKYYFDVILKPFSKFMLQAIEKISGLDIKMICPGHGPVLRSYWKKYVDISAEYARQYLEETKCNTQMVFIPYVSAYGYTATMAEKIGEGIREVSNVNIQIEDIQDSSLEELGEMISVSSALIIGSPTINQNILPQIYSLFYAINPIRDRGKAAAAFGSFGWSGEAVNIIEANLNVLKLKILQEGLKIRFSPDKESDELLRNFGREFGRKLAELKEN